MSTEGKIDLREALLENPQLQAQVAKMEGEVGALKDYTTLLRDTFQACHLHQKKVCEGTDSLAKLLNSYQAETYGDKDDLLSGSFRRIGRYLNELHSCQEMLSTQLQNAVVELLSLLLTRDFSNLEKLKESFESSSQEHDQAMAKFSRVSKKKDSEKASFEANSDLYASRRKHFETSLNYYSEMNNFLLKRKFSLMEPLLTFMHAQTAYFKVGHEILSKDLGKLLNELNTEVQKVHGRYQHEMEVMAEVRAEIELDFPNLCLPDPDPADPFSEYHVPDTMVMSKAGYLFIRNPKTGFPSKWDRCYFYTKKNQIYMQPPQKPPEMLLSLKGAEASSVDIDDRRFVFQINHVMLKRPVYLLAENAAIRDEWIAAINFIGKNKGSAQAGKEDSIKQERERIRSWVNKEINKPPVPKATPTTNSTLAPTPPAPQQGEQKKSPVLIRKLAKQKYSEPTLVSPQRTATQPSQLQAPLLPEKVGQAATNTVTSSNGTMATYSSTFTVKYLGHTEVPEGRTVGVISETIRKVTVARSMKNVKSTQIVMLTATHRAITLMDPTAKKSIGQILLKDILRCAVHPENSRLFGIVNRIAPEKDKSKLICHVLEAQNGMAVCSAVNSAIQTAYMNRQHSRSKSAQLQIKESTDSPTHSQGERKPSPVPSYVGAEEKLTAGTPPSSSDYITSESLKPGNFCSSGPGTHKSSSETNLSALAGGPYQPSFSVSASSSASSSNDQLNLTDGNGLEIHSSSLRSAVSDELLSDNGSTTFTSDYLSDGPLPISTPSKPPPPLPTLFETNKPAQSGYLSSDQFDSFTIDSPDSDSIHTPKLTTQDAAIESGYFPMPSILGTPPTQQQTHQQNGSLTSLSSNGKPEKSPGGEVSMSEYVAAPSDLSGSAPSSQSSSSQTSRSTLSSTSAAVAKKSRQLFAKVLPKKSSSSSQSKGSKSKGETTSQQQNKPSPQQLLVAPPSLSSPPSTTTTTTGELEANDDSDMGDLVDLLDLGEPITDASYGTTNGNQSLSTSTNYDSSNTSGYYQDPSVGVGVAQTSSMATPMPSLTPDPFVPQSTVSATNNSGYYPSPDVGGMADLGSAPPTTTPPFQPFTDDDQDDDFFLPDLPSESEMNSAGDGFNYGGSIVTFNTKK